MLEFSKILEHFEHLYGHLPVPMLVFDMHRIVRKANNAFCCLAEQDPAEATGRSINDFFEKLTRFIPTGAIPAFFCRNTSIPILAAQTPNPYQCG